MKNIFTLLLVAICSFPAFSQSDYQISGKIIDESSGQPLQGASVFAENTTIGTASDADGIFRLRLPNGGYSLVVTYTGYQTETKRVAAGDAGNSNLVIAINKKEKSLDDVVVKATYEVKDGLEKYGSFFIDNFIGKTPNSRQCYIKNTDVLKFYFYRKTNRLKIIATAPLEIQNDALGYTIKYELDSFVHEYNTQVSLYTGYPLFQEMESASIDQLLKWNAARREAYNGSILHFMRSMYQKRLKEEGFEIQFIVKNNNRETAQKLKDFYGPMNYSRDDSSNTVEIMPQQKDVAVIYKNEGSSPQYIEANPEASAKFQLSVLSFQPGESLDIEQNGFYFEQNDITITGYLAWEKVADMLPYDFKEKATKAEKVAITETPVNSNTSQKENPVVQTQKTEPVKSGALLNGGLLTAVTWKMEESRVIEGNAMFYYKRGQEGNTVNFDNDLYKFNDDQTGIYFYNGQQYSFTWKYGNDEKTKIEMTILYPTPLIVNLENVNVSPISLQYTRLQKVNGINQVAIESRSVK